jgi:uncharacterized 2Fe-2S/4Fe-4S cluster protein (DUF4445 family)
MTTCTLQFVTADDETVSVQVPRGTTLSDAALEAGIELNIPCGGQGRCGRCAVIVESGAVRRRSTLRLSAADVQAGYALACQTVVEGDARVRVPPQEKIERLLETDKTAAKITVPFAYDPALYQSIRRECLFIDPPTLADNTDDMSRLRRVLAQEKGIGDVRAGLPVLQRLSDALRTDHWQVTAVIETDTWDMPNGPPRLVDVLPGDRCDENWGLAIDIGTTSNVVYLVNLINGDVVQQAADYNGQIRRGEDVISRIIYASKGDGLQEMQELVVGTLNKLIARVCRQQGIESSEVHKATVAGNSTMIHLFLALPPQSIRLEPYITTVNRVPSVRAVEIGLNINPEATVDCLPGVASYVGADITAGVVSSGMLAVEDVTLFIDIGTNGEMVLGDGSWLITCACSAGPAFEGAGMAHGMRATRGAIEAVWINGQTVEPAYRVIGAGKPRGICGSGLITLLAEMFITGVIDKSGNLNHTLDTPRIRSGEHGDEYVIAWGHETAHGDDIVITRPDVDNLLRAKAAIYAGFASLAQSVGIDLDDISQAFIGGAFGQYLDIEKAIQIGLLPDMPWEKFHFLGNTSIKGAYMALLNRDMRAEIDAAASKMTYLELSADNTYYDHFTSALFLPHTDIERFPSVMAVLGSGD